MFGAGWRHDVARAGDRWRVTQVWGALRDADRNELESSGAIDRPPLSDRHATSPSWCAGHGVRLSQEFAGARDALQRACCQA
jgi:hypothetical protein